MTSTLKKTKTKNPFGTEHRGGVGDTTTAFLVRFHYSCAERHIIYLFDSTIVII